MSIRLVRIARIPVLPILFAAIEPPYGEAMEAVRRINRQVRRSSAALPS